MRAAFIADLAKIVINPKPEWATDQGILFTGCVFKCNACYRRVDSLTLTCFRMRRATSDPTCAQVSRYHFSWAPLIIMEDLGFGNPGPEAPH